MLLYLQFVLSLFFVGYSLFFMFIMYSTMGFDVKLVLKGQFLGGTLQSYQATELRTTQFLTTGLI